MIVPVRAIALSLMLFAPGAVSSAEPVVLGEHEKANLTELASVRGESLTSADLEGRAVVVTFFASWCPPCRTEFLHLNTIAAEFADSDLSIVAVNVFEEFDDNDAERLARFLTDTEPKFFVLEGNEEVRRVFADVQRIPTLFIFDRSGRPVMHFIHERGAKKMSVAEDELRVAVNRALSD